MVSDSGYLAPSLAHFEKLLFYYENRWNFPLDQYFSNKFCFAEHGCKWYQKMQNFMDNLINKMKYHMKEIFNYNYTE